MYSELVEALVGLYSVKFTEHEWATRPAGDHGTVQLDFDAAQDTGDDRHMDRARQGSVDLYTHGRGEEQAGEVEGILERICGGSWHLNLQSYEHDTGLLHREYIFELEA